MKKTVNTMKTARMNAEAGKSREFTKLRNHDFVCACRSVLDRYRRLGRRVIASRVVAEVLRSGAPSYYVSLDHCVETVSRILAGRVPKNRVMMPTRKRMWAEITRQVEMRLNSEGSKSLTQCVADVLTHDRASEFFISEGYALRIFRNHFKSVSNYEAV